MSKIHERIKAKRKILLDERLLSFIYFDLLLWLGESSMKKSLTTELLASPSQAIRNISNNTNLFFQSLSMASQSKETNTSFLFSKKLNWLFIFFVLGPR